MRTRVVLIRRGSLLLLVGWVAFVGFFLVNSQVRRRPALSKPDFDSLLIPAGDQAVSVRRGFVYSDTLGVEPNFRVAARETVEFASGWYELRDVEVWLYHQGRVAYGLVAERARYNAQRQEAVAEGQAHVSLRAGGVVRASGFSFSGPDQQMTSLGPVTVAGPGWAGLADQATFFSSDDRMVLEGGVSVTWRGEDSESPVLLLAPAMEYLQRNSLARLTEGLTVLKDRISLKSLAGEVQLGPGATTIHHARFTGPVTLEGALPDGSFVDLRTGDVEVTQLGGDRFRCTTWPLPSPGWVHMLLQQADGVLREVRSRRFTGEGRPGAWEWLESQDGSCITEIPAAGDQRFLEARTIRAEFAEGQPTTATGSGEVHLHSLDRWARGESIQFSTGSGRFLLRPAKKGRVTFGSAEMSSSADLLEGGEGSEVVASGKVTGSARRSASSGDGEEPYHFAADTVSSSADGSVITLTGDARLWQGARLIRADRLELDRTTEVVTGHGGVLTTTVAEAAESGASIRIRSRTLAYVRSEGRAVYEGDVVMEDIRGTAKAQRVVSLLNDEGRLQTVELDGGVILDEAGSARRVVGQRAVLDAQAQVLDVWGEPVLVQEPTGNQIKATHLRWLRALGTIVVVGADGEPTETLYRPEATPVPGRKRL